MNIVIALLFTLLYTAVACFLGVLGSIHGASLFPYFVLGLLILVLGLWWWLCIFLPARKIRHPALMLILCGTALGLLLVACISAGQRPLVAWDVRQMEKRAAATQVAGMRDEPLLWRESTPIGVRLHYSMRFSDSNYFWQSPFLFSTTDVGDTVGWNIVAEAIEPPLQIVKTVAGAAPIETAHLPADVRAYEKGKVYNFTVDLVPDFLALSADMSRVCIVRPTPQVAAKLEKLLSRDANIPYSVTVSGTNYRGATRNAYNLKTFYLNAMQNGGGCKYEDGRISFH